ncbi:MAG: glucose-6-phosphate isomerase [Halothiobacillus sp.]|jgi:glucose-6-phosphate isomerase|nr:glucose-6-phosphate isomerase [Halothiobacillus sp.]
MSQLIQSAAWQALETHAQTQKRIHLADLFDGNPGRAQVFVSSVAGLHVDYSKQRITPETLKLLRQLANDQDVLTRRDAMFEGARINTTENRAVLHVALRNRGNRPILADGKDVMPEINDVLRRMRRFTDAVHEGRWLGCSGERITDVVNIGIGGSDLGPRMICHALASHAQYDMRAHFIANIAPSEIANLLKTLDPARTLFVVASKTFTTQETLTNAHTARRWLLDFAGDETAVAKHFVAVSTNRAEVEAFGIDAEHMFGFWDWVGGRYSLWSAIGLPIALYIGMDGFERLLEGAHAMDEHFRTAPVAENLPLTLGLIDVWNSNFLGAETLAVLPYGTRLGRLPAYLQQASMESNGKSVDLDGHRVDYVTGPVVWGGPGTNGQHAFYQLLHQGTRLIPSDFIAAIRTHTPVGDQQAMLLANLLAQTRALMLGRSLEAVKQEMQASGADADTIARIAPHRVCLGNQPSTTILFPQMTPEAVGALVALYEHRIFVAGAIWHIDSYDQWGVELGKQMAGELLPAVGHAAPGTFDASTEALLQTIHQHWV